MKRGFTHLGQYKIEPVRDEGLAASCGRFFHLLGTGLSVRRFRRCAHTDRQRWQPEATPKKIAEPLIVEMKIQKMPVINDPEECDRRHG